MILNVHDRILAAAVRVFEECGSRGATTRRIAEEAGVNEVTLFRHFGSKEKLLLEALAWTSTRTGARVKYELPSEPADPAAELTKWCHLHLRMVHERRMLIRTSMAEYDANPCVGSCAAEIPTMIADSLRSYLMKLQELGIASQDFDVYAATALLMGAVFSDAMGRDITPGRFPYTLEEAAERYASLFLKSIGVKQSDTARGKR